MPELNLSKELEMGGRKFPLWVPVIGGGIAVLAVVAVKLKGKGGGGELPASVTPGGTAAAQAGTDNTGQFQSALGQLQASLQERIAAVQEQGAQAAGQITGLQALTGTLTGQVSGLQTTLQQQTATLAGYQGQLAEQSQALQAGLASTAASATQFKADVNARMNQVERRINEIQTQGVRINEADRFAVAQMGWTLARYIDETRGGTATPITPPATIDAQGNIQQGTGYLLRWR